MSKSYSIAEAKNWLGRLVHEVENGTHVELRRRGKPVAMVVSIDAWESLQQPRRSVWDAISSFRSEHDLESLDIDPDEVFSDPAGNRSAGKAFSW